MTVRTGTTVDASLTTDFYPANPCKGGVTINAAGYERSFLLGYLAGVIEGGDVIEAKQSTARTVTRRILDAATAQPRTVTAGDIAGAVIQLKKIGAAFATISPTLTARDTFLDIDLTSGNLDTLGETVVTIAIPGCVPTSVELDVVSPSKADPGSWEHDTGVTFGGLMKRLEAFMTGEKNETAPGGATNHVEWLDKDGDVAFEGDNNEVTGARAAADVSGSE